MRKTIRSIFVLGMLTVSAVSMLAPSVAVAEKWDTWKSGAFWNWEDWAFNHPDVGSVAALEQAAIAWCKQSPDYLIPGVDCEMIAPPSTAESVSLSNDALGWFYHAHTRFHRRGGTQYGNLIAHWYINTLDSSCPVGEMIDPELGYNCIDPGYRLEPEEQPTKDCNAANESNPCNPANGNKSQREIDYAGVGNGGLTFARQYNSQGANKTAPNMGAGWRHSYSRSMDVPPDRLPTVRSPAPPSSSSFYPTATDACSNGWDNIKATVWSGDLALATSTFVGGNRCAISMGGSVVANFPVRSGPAAWTGFLPPPGTKTITRQDGGNVYFDFDGTNWVNQFDPSLSLVASGSNWIFTDANDTKETYDASGKLTAISYRNGQTEALEYDLTVAEGGDDDGDTLDRVTGPFGHEITFTYDGGDRLETVTTPDGTIQYAYDAFENISSVTYPGASVRQYHYENTYWPNHLTGITDENADRYATWAYDAEGRAILSEHAGGKEQVQFAYNIDGTTTLTMGNGSVRHYDYVTEQGARKLSMLSGDVCSTCPGGNIANRNYDSNGFLYDATDWKGNITRTVRNSRGLTETLIEGFGSAQARTTTTVWETNFRLPTSVTSPQNSTSYTYDANGNVLTITVSGGGNSRTWTFTYNTDSQPLTINGSRTDVADVTTLEYYTCTTGAQCGQLKKVTNALGHVTNFNSYDSAGRLLQMTGPNGLQTLLTYDSRGRVLTTTQTPPVGIARVTTLTYDNVGQLLTMTLPDSAVLTYAYDAAHYLTSITDNLGNYVSYTYDAMGQLIDEDTFDSTATLKRALDYAQDLNYRLDAVTDGGFTTDLTYDLVGNLTGETDPNMNLTQHTYDALNRLDTTIDALTGVIDFGYDDHDNLTQVVAANGATTSYIYDNLDNLLSESSPDRGMTTYTHDAAGNRLTATDARAVTTTYAYDALNRLISVSYPDSTENVVYGYDNVASNGIGRLTSINDQSGTTAYTYDGFGSVVTDSRLISGVTYTVSYQYDAAGNVTSIAYPSGRSVGYGRNAIGQVTQATSTKNGVLKNIVTSASYEPFGPLKDLTYGNGLNFDYQHRTDYRTSSILSASIVDKSYGYDSAGNIKSIVDSAASSVSQFFEVDALNRVVAEEQTAYPNYSTYSTYVADVLADNPRAYWRLSEASPAVAAADATGNGHDAVYSATVLLGQPGLVSVLDTAIHLDSSSGGYLEGGDVLTGVTLTGLEFWFETSSLTMEPILITQNTSGYHVVTAVFHQMTGHVGVWLSGTGTVVLQSDNTVSTGEPHHVAVWYEAGSNTTYLMIDGVTQQITYNGNPLGVSGPRVLGGAHYYGGSQTPILRMLGELDEVALYDTPVNANTFSSHYSIVAGGATGNDFTYDANGNRTSRDDGSTITTFGYQALSNRLTSIASATVQLDAAGNQIADVTGTRTFSYDDTGRLDEVLDNSVITATYVHNALGQRAIKSVGSAQTIYVYDLNGGLLAEHDNTGTLIRDYVRLNGTPVAQIDQGEVVSYLHFDHLGTPRQATNDSQAIVWRWDGDAFGATQPNEDPDGNGTDVTVNLRFPGQYFDGETGFHYNYFRTLDPSTGRYLESDPIGLNGGLNTFGYVGGNPLRGIDPFGLLEIFGPVTDSQRAAIEQAEDLFRQGLGDICAEERSKLESILDNGTATVDPLINDTLRRADDAATANYEIQNIQFNHGFFADPEGRSSTFTHETRHLMKVNNDLKRPSDLTTIFVGNLDPEAYFKLPREVDARLFTDIYNQDACFCEVKP